SRSAGYRRGPVPACRDGGRSERGRSRAMTVAVSGLRSRCSWVLGGPLPRGADCAMTTATAPTEDLLDLLKAAAQQADGLGATPPPYECDLVMKGGITSGIVYPPAI